MSSKDFDYDVDRQHLDDEWVQHPGNVWEASERLADAKKEASLAKRRLEVLEAEIELEVRKNPDKFGLTKVTEGSIASAVICDNRVEAANQELIKAEHYHDLCRGSINALDAKKKALEDLVYLWNSSYFAAPRAPEGTKAKMDEVKRNHAFGRGKPREER